MVRYSKSIFINCPFDSSYKPILDAITFIILDAGFVPRTALEQTDTGAERLKRIVALIAECQYSIHDISRMKTARKQLVRFNMPFECGLCYGALAFGGRKQKNNKILVLDSAAYRYQAAMSDIAGKDIGVHKDDPLVAIACVRRFLNDKTSSRLPGEKHFQKRYQRWQSELARYAREFHLTKKELLSLDYWPDYLTVAGEWMKRDQATAYAKRPGT